MPSATANKWRYMAAAVQFTSSPLAGAIGGHYLDVYFKTDPIIAVIGLIAGMVTGTVYLIRILREPQDNS